MNKLTIILLMAVILVACDNNIKSKTGSSEYVVQSSLKENLYGFDVIDIDKNDTVYVEAVRQLNGNMYLPIMSSLPEYNNKVVKGYFVNDTNYYLDLSGDIFVVTTHKRDTTNCGY